jgi:GNAT superfamily N-acetyltransferase
MSDLVFRTATRGDVETIVRMLADDVIGGQREQAGAQIPPAYFAAFAAIDADPNNELLVAERSGRVVGVLQLTYIPNLTYQGGWRALVEGVRVAGDRRGRGLGAALLREAIARAERRGCVLVQLTSDKQRKDAIRFYESVGFRASHEGMKLFLRRFGDES